MIRILWPTIRPKMMMETYAHWLHQADDPKSIEVMIAVNTKEEVLQLDNLLTNGKLTIIVVGSRRRGACYAVYKLGQHVQGDPDDIIILASDDFYPSQGWDTAIKKQMEGWDGALLVADRMQEKMPNPNVMTIPIMRMSCLLKLNRILNHPLYHCWAADNELYMNLNAMGLIKNVRKGQGRIMIEHHHWKNGKREADEHDRYAQSQCSHDRATWKRRMKMPLKQRLASLPEGV